MNLIYVRYGELDKACGNVNITLFMLLYKLTGHLLIKSLLPSLQVSSFSFITYKSIILLL